MPETYTSPAIISLVLIASALALYAWWLSIQQSRRFRDLVSWVEENHPDRWQALSSLSRALNVRGGIETLRREGFAEDPAFMERYHESRRGNGPKLAAILTAMAAIAIIPLGIQYWGWTW